MKIKYTFFFFLLTAPFLAKAQSSTVFTPNVNPVIIVDRATKTSPPLPFDRNFTLRYPLIATDDILNVFVYEVELINGERHLRLSNGNPIRINTKKNDTTKTTLDIHVLAIRPNTPADVLVINRLTDKQADTVINIADSRRTVLAMAPGTTPNLAIQGVEANYKTFISHLKSTSYTENPGVAKLSYNDFITLYDSDLLPKLDQINAYDYGSYPSGTSNPTALPTLRINDLQDLDAALLNKKLNDDDLQPVAAIIQENLMGRYLNGTIDISAKYPLASEVPISNYTVRINNLTSAITYFDKFLALLDRAILAGIPLNNYLYQAAGAYRVALAANKKVIKSNYIAMVTAIKAKGQLCTEDWIITQNDFNDLVSLGKSFVITDLGVTTLALHGHNNWQFYPRPFVAVNFYFRPVDKSLKESYFNQGNHGFWRCAALQIGLTYGKLGGSEFSSLFNDFSLLGGASYRFARWFKVAGGTVVTQQTSENPLISSLHTHFGYYVAFSFDIDIFSSASQLTSRIFK